jgi:hypothetical protein
MNLADAISQAHAANESKLAAQVPAYQMDSQAQRASAAFVRWCNDRGVRPLPAAPATVAAYVQFIGARPEEVASALMAIQEIHDEKGMPSPVAAAAVRSTVTRILDLKPPRSWRKAEQLMFAELPIEVRAVIARREEDRDRELRRLQNELAKLKYRHGGAKPAIEEKEITK